MRVRVRVRVRVRLFVRVRVQHRVRVVAHHGLPVVLGLGELPAVRRRVLHPLAEQRRLVHQLLGDAPASTSGEGWSQAGAKGRDEIGARLSSVAGAPDVDASAAQAPGRARRRRLDEVADGDLFAILGSRL